MKTLTDPHVAQREATIPTRSVVTFASDQDESRVVVVSAVPR